MVDWTHMFDAHGPALILFARQWLHSHAEAEEALQDGFVRFWRAYRENEWPETDVLPLLFTYVKRAALDRLRRQRRQRAREESAARMLYDEGAVFETPAADARRAEMIANALGTLPPEQREVVVMKIWGGATFKQIATALGLSPNTAASRYRYGLRRLRDSLPREVRGD